MARRTSVVLTRSTAIRDVRSEAGLTDRRIEWEAEVIRSDEDQTLPALGRLYPRYGGPEEIITPETSRLMPVEDPDDLATGIELVLDRRCTYNPRRLHQDVIAASAPWQSADESKPSTTRC